MFFQPILLLAEMKKERSCSRKNEKRNRSSLFCSAFRSAVYMEKGMASSDAVHPLKYRVSSARYPMSSVERAKKRGQKRPFLASFFACFLLQNHNILWYNRSIFPFYHKTSSLSLLQRVSLLLSEHILLTSLLSCEHNSSVPCRPLAFFLCGLNLAPSTLFFKPVL